MARPVCLIGIITMVALCYGRYNSFRTKRVGMQELDELTPFVTHERQN